MATRHIGRKGAVGIGLETTPGTAVSPTLWFYQAEMSTIKPVEEYIEIPDAHGQYAKPLKHKQGKRRAEGDIIVGLDPASAPYLFGGILGTISSTLASGETAVYEHTITLSETAVPAKTYTITREIGDTFEDAYTNAICSTLKLEVSDGRAIATATWVANTAAADTETPSYSDTTMFIFADYTVKMADTITNAEASTAIPVNEFSLEINRDSEARYASGDRDPSIFVHKQLEVSGELSLDLTANTYRGYYTAGTNRAISVSFLGSAIGSAEYEEVKIRLSQVTFTENEPDQDNDDVDVDSMSFVAEYDDTTDSRMIQVIVTNQASGSDY